MNVLRHWELRRHERRGRLSSRRLPRRCALWRRWKCGHPRRQLGGDRASKQACGGLRRRPAASGFSQEVRRHLNLVPEAVELVQCGVRVLPIDPGVQPEEHGDDVQADETQLAFSPLVGSAPLSAEEGEQPHRTLEVGGRVPAPADAVNLRRGGNRVPGVGHQTARWGSRLGCWGARRGPSSPQPRRGVGHGGRRWDRGALVRRAAHSLALLLRARNSPRIEQRLPHARGQGFHAAPVQRLPGTSRFDRLRLERRRAWAPTRPVGRWHAALALRPLSRLLPLARDLRHVDFAQLLAGDSTPCQELAVCRLGLALAVHYASMPERVQRVLDILAAG
mmetsp:Transcript_21003/g.58661  ORF Transcript_21003/g.58661 Transcript_21003/m.58661 type:complete len:335 (-) Transcript_21003:294-1298(-)